MTIMALTKSAAWLALRQGQPAPEPAPPPPPPPPAASIALTFDYYNSTFSAAFPIMQSAGLVGTYFNQPDQIGATHAANLRTMQAAGWAIGAYSAVNMVDYLQSNGSVNTRNYLVSLCNSVASHGLNVTALAPTSRAWNQTLRDLAVGVFERVRVAKNFDAWQTYPYPDPLWINDGGTESLDSGDTPQTLAAQLAQVQAAGKQWIVVVHRVGDDAFPDFSVSAATFTAFCSLIAAEKAAGRLNVVTM